MILCSRRSFVILPLFGTSDMVYILVGLHVNKAVLHSYNWTERSAAAAAERCAVVVTCCLAG
jgi:hypothetical protein